MKKRSFFPRCTTAQISISRPSSVSSKGAPSSSRFDPPLTGGAMKRIELRAEEVDGDTVNA